MVRAAALVAVALTLGLGAVPGPADAAGEPPAGLDRKLFREYLGKRGPKAFAFAPSTGRAWYAWGYRTLAEARAVALRECEALGRPCAIYAENDTVVWRGGGAAPAEPGLPLDAEGRARFEEYARRPLPKAFAYAPKTGQTWNAWGYGSPAQTQQIALSKCESFGSPCVLLAIDDEVVWRPEASPTAPRFAEPIVVQPLQGRLTARENARLRSLPTTASRAVGRLARGSGVDVTGRVRGVDWYRVALDDGREAYVYAPLLAGEIEAPTEAPRTVGADWEVIEDLRRRAEAGEADAQFDLGIRYDHGVGVERDGYEARYWFKQAADQGHALAAYHLGLAYELGDGVDVNLAEAVRLFEISAAAGHDVSVRKLERYRPLLERQREQRPEEEGAAAATEPEAAAAGGPASDSGATPGEATPEPPAPDPAASPPPATPAARAEP